MDTLAFTKIGSKKGDEMNEENNRFLSNEEWAIVVDNTTLAINRINKDKNHKDREVKRKNKFYEDLMEQYSIDVTKTPLKDRINRFHYDLKG